MVINVLLVGVGGQGTITASQALAQACLLSGWEVKKSEVHGMSQRGGSVESHVRFAPEGEVYSPTIPEGEVDVLIGFELLEGLRALPQVREAGLVVVDPRRIVPMTVTLGQTVYPEDALEQLRAGGRRTHIVAATAEALCLGEVRAANILLLGAASSDLGLTREAMEEAIRLTVKPRALEINLAAFARGIELAELGQG
jgi:indolepyruvate ferredoxin oxidoreductase beta subunit